jgi:cellulose synthase (UDP-forming)
MTIPSEPVQHRREVRWEEPGLRTSGASWFTRQHTRRAAYRAPWRRSYERHNERDDRGRRIRARLLSALAGVAGIVYLTLLPGALNPATPIVSGLLLSTELFFFTLFLLTAAVLWSVRYKPRTGRPTAVAPSIDVFIPVSDEPRIVVERALTSAACLEWDGPLEVHVLDDGASLELEVRARELGFQYHSRAREGVLGHGDRAGNLNFGLQRSRGELVYVLDPDRVVRYEALVPLAGYLAIQGVAFVQARESFVVPTGDPFNSQHPVLLDSVQVGYEARDTVISTGSSVLYRRLALQDIGGFVEWNEAEGLATSLELHSRGWKSLFFPYPMTTGLAPANIAELYQQRIRTFVDTMRLFIWDNPMRKPELSWPRRLNHLLTGFACIVLGLFLPAFLLLPVWSYLTGAPLVVAHIPTLVIARAAYFVLFAAAATYLLHSRSPAKQFRLLAGLFPVYFWATVRAFFRPPRRNAAAKDTPPAHRGGPAWPRWACVLPQMAILAANAVLPLYVLMRAEAITWGVGATLLLSAFAVWTLWPVVFHGLRYRTRAVDVVSRQR